MVYADRHWNTLNGAYQGGLCYVPLAWEMRGYGRLDGSGYFYYHDADFYPNNYQEEANGLGFG